MRKYELKGDEMKRLWKWLSHVMGGANPTYEAALLTFHGGIVVWYVTMGWLLAGGIWGLVCALQLRSIHRRWRAVAGELAEARAKLALRAGS